MKTSKNIIIIMFILCMMFGAVAIFLEFNCKVLEKNIEVLSHVDFYINVSLGFFSSGILVLVPSITQYITEKGRYYIEVQKILNEILYYSREIIKGFENNNSQVYKFRRQLESIKISYEELISHYSTFTYFFRYSDKDKLIETIIVVAMKFILANQEFQKYYKQFESDEISESDYNKYLKITSDEMTNNYKSNFIKYQKLVEKHMSNKIGEKKLNKYF